MKTYTFHVSGTHCASCKILIEDILNDEKDVQKAMVNLKHQTVEITTESEKDPQQFANELTEKTKANGYILSLEKNTEVKKESATIWQALPIGLGFLILFFLLQKSGVLNLGIGGATTPVTSFIIGLIASVSSCLAIVGGLILSLSAKVAQDEGSKTSKKQFVLFHGGRLAGFAILGGMLGLIGKAIGVSFTFSAILGIIASSVMILLGLNLVGIIKKNKVTLPTGIFAYFRKIEHSTFAPILVGVGTFFLPCGFTQSMQIAALSSGSFISGLLIMLSFALGTLPMLGLLSFSSVSFAQSRHALLFFKSAGVVVIGLGIFALLAGLAGLGVIAPLFNI
jgi:sulfite exporter TauE/SafE/copper chaperone CopZ